MTREEAIEIIRNYDINGCGYCHQGGNEIEEAFEMAIKALKQEPCGDCISRAEAMRAITDEWVRGKHTLEGFTAVLYNLPPVIPERAESKGIDDFVAFLIRENCEGCKECEPRLSSDWKPNFACVEEGRAKWLLAMAEKYKAEKEGER